MICKSRSFIKCVLISAMFILENIFRRSLLIVIARQQQNFRSFSVNYSAPVFAAKFNYFCNNHVNN